MRRFRFYLGFVFADTFRDINPRLCIPISRLFFCAEGHKPHSNQWLGQRGRRRTKQLTTKKRSLRWKSISFGPPDVDLRRRVEHLTGHPRNGNEDRAWHSGVSPGVGVSSSYFIRCDVMRRAERQSLLLLLLFLLLRGPQEATLQSPRQ